MSRVIHDSPTHDTVDVTATDCPYCNQLRCTDWLTCPGYLRAMVSRLEQAERLVDDERRRLARSDRRLASCHPKPIAHRRV